MPVQSLKSINNKMKMCVNEATSTSDKCKSKFIKLVEKHFFVELPHDNYKNIDIEILENGNIKMRDVEYETSEKIEKEEDLFERFNTFHEEAEELLSKSELDFGKQKSKGNISNLFILLLYGIFSLIIILYGIKRLLFGDILGVLWLIVLMSYYIIPLGRGKVTDRIEKAKRFFKSVFKK